MSTEIRFDDRVALITGAGKGLGRAYAKLLASRGAKVVVNNRRHDNDASSSADLVVAEIAAAGGEALGNYESVEQSGAGQRMVAATLERFGRLDILICNAGVAEGRTFRKQQDLDRFRRVFEINFFGSADVAHAAFKVMHAAGYGRIVFSTSGAGLYGQHGMPAYSSSKAALLGLMHALRLEGQSHDIVVNTISPLATTRMTAGHFPQEVQSRMQPEHVAPVVGWFASEQCNTGGDVWITGGGYVRRAHTVEGIGLQLAPEGDPVTVESVAQNLAVIRDVGKAEPRDSASDGFEDLTGRL